MKWEKVKLGEVSRVSSSKRIFARQYVRKGVPFYRQKEIIDKKNKNFIIDPLFISVETYNEIKKKFGVPVKGDLLITAVGASLGIPYIVDDEIFYFKDGNLIWLSNFNENINSKYIYYWITSDIGQKMMWSRVIGSAQPALTIDIIKQFELSIPTYILQNKIVKILETYDKLIENNQKQIKLLEEAAQRLYKEWFVNLRFPGYENTPIIDGVPEGWKKGILGDIAINVGKKVKKEDRNKYKQYLPIDCLPRKSLAYTESLNIKLAESSLVSFKPKDILFGAMRPYFHKVVIAYDKGLTRNTCFVINAKEREFLSYLTMLLFSDNTINYATTISVGTTMPYVRLNDFLNMEIIIPAPHIVKEFEKLFKPISEDIVNFAKQIGVLSEARDRLLTKLMSGEIEV